MTACKKLAAVTALFATVGTARASGIGSGLAELGFPDAAFEVVTGSYATPHKAVALATLGTAGAMRCVRFVSPATGNISRFYFRTTAGLAASQGQMAVYSADGTSRLAQGDVEATTSGALFETTGLTLPLVRNVAYLACFGTSATATLTTYAIDTGGGGIAHPLQGSAYPSVYTTANVMQFNDACTAGATPYACCSGADTGTCTGAPTSTGALTAVVATTTANAPPFMWIAK